MVSDSTIDASRALRTAALRVVAAGGIGYSLAYLAFGALVGFSIDNLTLFLVSSVVIWIAAPWVLLDVYANARESRPDDLAARARGISFPVLFTAGMSVFLASWFGRGYASLVFWMLAGAVASVGFTKMLLAAYERGRAAGGASDARGG